MPEFTTHLFAAVPRLGHAAVLLTLIAGMLAGTAPGAHAQDGERPVKSNTERLFLQVTLDAQSVDYREEAFSETDSGGGLTLRAGWGVSPLVTLYAGVTGATIDGDTNGITDDAYSFGGGELGVRLNFRSGRSLIPYANVALRGVAATEDDLDLEFRGGGITLGGGVAYYVTPAIAIDAGLHFGGGRFNEVQVGDLTADIDSDDFGYGEGRLSFGLSFYPLR